MYISGFILPKKIHLFIINVGIDVDICFVVTAMRYQKGNEKP